MDDFIIKFDPKIGDVITKEQILKHFTEEEIFSYYGIPIQKGLFRNPARCDHNPTVSLFRNRSGRLLMKDFGTNWVGDCFAYVAALYNTNFQGALWIIANDFGLIKTEEPKNMPKIEYKGEKVEERPGAILKCEIQPFTAQELAWWGSYGITEKTLNHFNVFSVKNLWLNGNLFHLGNNIQKVFGYYGGIDKDSIEKWRIYFPGRKKYKFINNWPSTMIQGLQQMPSKGDVLFIQKALKDVMVMYEMGYTAIAPNSENTPLDDDVIKALKKRYKRIIVWMDNDEAGINSLARMQESFPELEYYHLPINGEKDLSDYVKKFGKEKGQELIREEFFSEEW